MSYKFQYCSVITLLILQRKRLEERRLPQALLEAFAAEQKTRLLQRKQRVPAKKKKRKIKTFTDSDGEEGDGSVQNIDEGEFVSLFVYTDNYIEHKNIKK